jgi:hypothetical protein
MRINKTKTPRIIHPLKRHAETLTMGLAVK